MNGRGRSILRCLTLVGVAGLAAAPTVLAAPDVRATRSGDQTALRVAAPGVEYVGATVTALPRPGHAASSGGAGVTGGAPTAGGVAVVPIGRPGAGRYRVDLRLRTDAGTRSVSRRITLPGPRRSASARACPDAMVRLESACTSGDGVYASDEVAAAIRSKSAHPECLQESRSDEHICFDGFNYLLAWTAAGAAAPPLLTGEGSVLWFPKDSDDAVKGGWVSGNGRHWWGPANASWHDDRDKANGLGFGRRWLIEFTDDGRSENSGEVTLQATAGDVFLGAVRNRMWNDGETTHGKSNGEWIYPRCDRSEGGWTPFVTCSQSGATHDPSIRKDDRFRDEVGFGFWFQNFPVRIAVESTLSQSRFVVERITTPGSFVRSPRGTTLARGASIDVGESPGPDLARTLWLSGFRSFSAKDAVTIEGRLESLQSPAEKGPWVGQKVTLEAALASSATAPPDEPDEKALDAGPGAEARWSSCRIASTSESGREATCSVEAASAGGPGALNQVTFVIRG